MSVVWIQGGILSYISNKMYVHFLDQCSEEEKEKRKKQNLKNDLACYRCLVRLFKGDNKTFFPFQVQII